MSTESTLQSSIRTSGRRLTRQRALVLKVLAESREHLDAEAIHERVKGRQPRVSLATIYRTLSLLKNLGLVDEYRLGEEHGHFEAVPNYPHHHFTCQKCHQVIEFQAPQITDDVTRLLESQGIIIDDVRLHVTGFCPSCRDSFSKES